MSTSFRDRVIALIPRLRAYAVGLTGDAASADDLVQGALVRAWAGRGQAPHGPGFEPWLFRLVRGEYLEGAWMPARRATPPRAAETGWRSRYGELLGALPRLTQDARDSVLLVVGSGMSAEQAAEVCGCSAEAMRARVRRATRRLAELADIEPPSGGGPRPPASRMAAQLHA